MGARRLAAGIAVDSVIAVLVLVVGLWVLTFGTSGPTVVGVAAVATAALAAGLGRSRPGVALAVVWLAGALHVVAASRVGGPFDPGGFGALDIAALVVAFDTARYGSRRVVWLGGASIPAAALVVVLIVATRQDAVPELELALILQRITGLGVVGAALAGMAVLATPWTIGLLLRLEQRHRRDERTHAVEQAHAVALAEEQAARTRLTREVHDVVGHSLAVIVAQADAARLAVPDTDPLVRDALARIAGVGRTSLAEVRDVLSRTGGEPTDPAIPHAGLDDLLAGVRSAGHEVHDTVTGEPVGLDAPLATTVYRVVQELLTNALKHGSGGAISLERVWTSSGLTVRLSNPAATDTPVAEDGTGLTGARARLAAHNGTLHTAAVRERFTATAHLPLGDVR